MTSVGKQLRSAREVQDRSLDEIAAELCVLPRYLRAIEEADLESVTGVFFYKSFVKQYAAALGLNADKLQTAVNALCPQTEPETRHVEPDATLLIFDTRSGSIIPGRPSTGN